MLRFHADRSSRAVFAPSASRARSDSRKAFTLVTSSAISTSADSAKAGQTNAAYPPMVMKSLSDPEWIPETPAEGPKSKGGLSTGGGQAGDPKPSPPKMPFPLRRAMELKAKGAALPEGERALPVAGLVFFPYRGKDSGIQNVELIYKGAAGGATITLVR